MTLLAVYAAFALATAISMWYEFFNPILKDAIASGVKNAVTESSKLSSAVYLIIHFLVAPAAVFVLLFPSLGTHYVSGLSKEIYLND